MDQSIDIEIGASGDIGGPIREVISGVNSVRDAVDALKGFLDGLRESFMEGFRPPEDIERTDRQVRDLTEEIRDLRQELERTQREMRETSREGAGLGASLGGIRTMAVGLLAGIGIVEVGKQIVETITDFERLRAVLTTLEGAEVSPARFDSLRKFAQETPYDLEQVVTAFTKLKSLGLDPSEASLRSYGNTASAMGKDLDQFIEAVADASTGEFERLKEFGIRASQEGDKVSLTFQGVTTTVGKNSTDIQNYLRAIGETKFAGAMDDQMNTLNGAFSNMADNAAGLADAMGQGGLRQAIMDVTTQFNEVTGGGTDVAAMLGGVLGTAITAISDIISTLWQVVQTVWSSIAAIIRDVTGSTGSDMDTWKQSILFIQQVIVLFGGVVQVTFATIGGILAWAVDTFSSAADAIDAVMRFDFSAAKAAVTDWGKHTVDTATKTYDQIRAISANMDARFAATKLGATDEASTAKLPGYTPPAQAGGGGSKSGAGGGGGQSVVQTWAEELQRMQQASGDYMRDNTQQELDFWTTRLARTKQGSDAWYDVQAKIYAASKTLAQQNYQDRVAQLDFEIQAAQGNFAQQAALEQQKVDLVRTTYGEQSNQFRNALREQERMAVQHEQDMARIQQQGLQQRLQIDREAAQTELQLQQIALDQLSMAIEYQENAGLMGRREAAAERGRIALAEFEVQRATEERVYQLRVQSLRDQLALEGLRPQEIARVNADLEREQEAHEQRMRVASAQQAALVQRSNTDAANATRQVWMDRLAPVTQALTGMVNGFLTGTTSVRQAMLQMGSQVLQSLNGWVMQWVQQHVAGQQAATAATVAGNAARTASTTAAAAAGSAANVVQATGAITTNAAVAGSGALASVSSIPVIGPFIAPAIAAGVLALAMGFIGKIASAEGGWGQVPYDGAMTELHKDEMVLPASIASPLRDSLSSKDSTWSLGQTGLAARQIPAEALGSSTTEQYKREGDVNFHLSALDTRSGVDWLMKNRRTIGKALGQTYRDGAR